MRATGVLANMGFLRKFLAASFAALSVFFALKAMLGKKPEATNATNSANWGNFSEANEKDMPVFFRTENIGDIDDTSKQIISENFVSTTIDEFGADYRALQCAAKNGGLNDNLAYGVLTPKMLPIFLSGRLGGYDTFFAPSLKTALSGTLNAYKTNKKHFDKLPKRIFFDRNFTELSPFKDDSTALFSFFMSGQTSGKYQAAVLANAAKAAFRTAVLDASNPFCTQSALLAKSQLLNGFVLKSENFIEHAQYALAIGEFAILFNSQPARDMFMRFAERCSSFIDETGVFTPPESKNLVAENALALSVQATAYKLGGGEKYANFVKTLSRNISQKCQFNSLKTNFSSKTFAGANEYALCARALTDAAIALKSKDLLQDALKVLDKGDAMFLSKNALWLELSEKSPLYKVLNAYICTDSTTPSTNGLLRQVLADIKRLSGGDAYAERLAKTQFLCRQDFFGKSRNSDFSAMLSQYPNPLGLNRLVMPPESAVVSVSNFEK